MTHVYRVADFARLAGVTVRTLQYYDRIGLLKPSGISDGGHRLYRRQDLLRLQQVLTLRWMGFELKQIQAILDHPQFDLLAALHAQQSAIQAQMRRLHAASAALEKAIGAVEAAANPEPDTLRAIIGGVLARDQDAHFQRYYTPEAWQGIQARALTYTPEEMAGFAQDWQDVYAAFRQHCEAGANPASADVQAVAAKMHTLLEGFTGGDPQARDGLRALMQDIEAGNGPVMEHDPFAGTDETLRTFMKHAYAIYEEENTR